MKKLTKSAGSLATKLVCLAAKRLQSRTGTPLCLCTSQTTCPFTTCATWLVSTAKAATKSIFNMNKELIQELAKATDCSTQSPLWVNYYTEQVVLECMNLVLNTPKHHAYTSYDLGLVEATIKLAADKIKQRFELWTPTKTDTPTSFTLNR